MTFMCGLNNLKVFPGWIFSTALPARSTWTATNYFGNLHPKSIQDILYNKASSFQYEIDLNHSILSERCFLASSMLIKLLVWLYMNLSSIAHYLLHLVLCIVLGMLWSCLQKLSCITGQLFPSRIAIAEIVSHLLYLWNNGNAWDFLGPIDAAISWIGQSQIKQCNIWNALPWSYMHWKSNINWNRSFPTLMADASTAHSSTNGVIVLQ